MYALSKTILVGTVMAALFSAAVMAQTPTSPDAASCPEVEAGMVVETVAEHAEGEKAGLRDGDIILGWTRGETKGEIRSAFDLIGVEIEQAPLGPVTLQGLRAQAKQSWTIGPSTWGITARPNLPENLLTIYREAEELAKAKNFAEAAPLWRKASEQSQCPDLSVWLLFHAASFPADVRQWQDADPLYRDAADRAAKDSSNVKAVILRAWANTFRLRNDLASARKYEEEAIEQARLLSTENLTVARSLMNLGNIIYLAGDVAGAQKDLEQALDLCRKFAPNSLATARSLNGLGEVVHYQGHLDKSIDYQMQALAIQQKINPDGPEVAGTYEKLGTDESERGELDGAEIWHFKALAIQQKLAPDSLNVAVVLNQLGIDRIRRGDLDGAEQYWSQALAIRMRLEPGSLSSAFVMGNLGLLARRRGDLAKAEQYTQDELAIEEKSIPGSLDIAKTFNNLGMIAKERGDFAGADDYLHRALAIKQRIGPGSLDVANTLGNAVRRRPGSAFAGAPHG